MLTFAVANAKGGVTKTTLAVHVAVGFARQGRKVLLVDLDGQGHASAWALGDAGELPVDAPTAHAALVHGWVKAAALVPSVLDPGVLVLPATPELGRADVELAGEVGGETLLAKALRSCAGLDVAVLDCPPNLGRVVLSALAAADHLLVPVVPSFLALTGLKRLTELVETARERLGLRVSVLGYVLAAVDAREGVSASVRRALQGSMGDGLFKSEVRVSTAAKALPGRHRTAWDAGEDPRGAEDYAAVLAEVVRRTRNGKGRNNHGKG